MKKLLVALIACTLSLTALNAQDEERPALAGESELIVVNDTGETLTLTIDGSPALTIETELHVDMAPGEHDLVIRDPAGDAWPKHVTMEADKVSHWNIKHAPDQG